MAGYLHFYVEFTRNTDIPYLVYVLVTQDMVLSLLRGIYPEYHVLVTQDMVLSLLRGIYPEYHVLVTQDMVLSLLRGIYPEYHVLVAQDMVLSLLRGIYPEYHVLVTQDMVHSLLRGIYPVYHVLVTQDMVLSLLRGHMYCISHRYGGRKACSMKVMDTHRGSLRTRHPGAASETRLPSRTGEPGWSGRTGVSLKWTSCHDESRALIM